MIWNADEKPPQGMPVLILMSDGSVHEGHWLKNANRYEQNVNRWRIYKTGKTVADADVIAWMFLPDGEVCDGSVKCIWAGRADSISENQD